MPNTRVSVLLTTAMRYPGNKSTKMIDLPYKDLVSAYVKIQLCNSVAPLS